MRLEFTTQERPRSNKDSVTSGNFTDKQPQNDIYINANCVNVRVSVEKPKTRSKTVEIWLVNVKPSTAKPYLHFLNRFCEYAKTDPDTLVKNAKSDSESIHNTLKAYRRKIEGQGIASYTLQLALQLGKVVLDVEQYSTVQDPKGFHRTDKVGDIGD